MLLIFQKIYRKFPPRPQSKSHWDLVFFLCSQLVMLLMMIRVLMRSEVRMVTMKEGVKVVMTMIRMLMRLMVMTMMR